MKMKQVAGFVLSVGIVCSMAQAADRYVVPGGTGGGSSWADAASLQAGVAGATAGCTVWVSNGVYTITSQIAVTNFTIKSYNNGVVDRDGTIISGSYPSSTNRCFYLNHSNAVVEGLTITNGYVISSLNGGGVYIDNNGGTLRNCLVIKCTAGLGGGVYATGAKSVVTNCDIIANTANNGAWNDGGGGVKLMSGAQVWNSRIVKNSSTSCGGGLCLTGSGLYNSSVISNTGSGASAGFAGVVVLTTTKSTLRNCLILGNNGNAGAGVGTPGGAADIENCTIVGNVGIGIGSTWHGAKFKVINTVCFYNSGGDIVPMAEASGYLLASNSCAASFAAATAGSSNNITKIPAFVNRTGGDYRLQPWSGGVDAGLVLSWMSSATDLAGQARVSVNGLPDMGAYETTAGTAPDQYVARNGQVPVSPYTNWVQAASNIQDAVAVAYDGGTVLVSNDVYTLTNHITVGNFTIKSFNNGALDRDGTIVRGGYPASTNRCFVLNNGAALVEGFTITNGFVINTNGGGVNLSAGTLRNCRVVGNTVTNGSGGGVYANGSGCLITNCEIIANSVFSPDGGNVGGKGGGGIYIVDGKVRNCRVLFNNVPIYANSGGGIWASGASIVNSSIISNKIALAYDSGTSAVHGYSGGGIWIGGEATTLRNCLIMGNGRSYQNTGAGVSVHNNYSSTVIENCTIVTNFGVGVGSSQVTTFRVANSIVFNNIGTAIMTTGGTIISSNSCATTTNGFIGTGNITNNPQFVNYAGGNYQLAKTSPCINNGTNQAWMSGAMDIAGTNRLDWRYGLVDMGAYEYVPLRPAGTLMMVR